MPAMRRHRQHIDQELTRLQQKRKRLWRLIIITGLLIILARLLTTN